MANLIDRAKEQFVSDFTLTGLRVAITVWAIMIIILAWVIKNEWVLAGILAYEVLP